MSEQGFRPPDRPSPAVYRRRRIAAAVIVLIAGVLTFQLFRLGTDLWAAAVEKWQAPAVSQSPTDKPEPTDTKGEVTACLDEEVTVLAELPDGDEYELGDTVAIRATFTYQGNSECLRDVGAKANEVTVGKRDGRQLWSSSTCPVNRKVNLVSMLPGDIYQVTVTWPGTRDPAKCGEVATQVQAGRYQVVVANGGAVSEPVEFRVG